MYELSPPDVSGPLGGGARTQSMLAMSLDAAYPLPGGEAPLLLEMPSLFAPRPAPGASRPQSCLTDPALSLSPPLAQIL